MNTGVLNVLGVNRGIICEQVEESRSVSGMKISIVVIIMMMMTTMMINNNNNKNKGKINPRTGHESPEGELRLNSTFL